MDKKPDIPKEFLDRYNKLTSELKQLWKDFGLSEYILFFTKYDNESGKYQWGHYSYNIQHQDNLDAYQDRLTGLKYTMIENKRFCDVLHLKEFLVECMDDSMTQELRNLQIKNGGDWIRRGETYTVFKRKKAIDNIGGYTFFLKNSDGVCLVPPYPFDGYHSARFKVVDYTKLN